MMDYFMLDILTVALLILLLCGAKIQKPFGLLNSAEYLSVGTGKSYRGLFAVVIVFHHLAQRTVSGLTFNGFGAVGYLSVAVFFFLSGYGLQKSYITKSDSYKKGFLLKRIPSIMIPYCIVAIFYWLANLVIYKYLFPDSGIVTLVTDKSLAASALKNILSNSWFIINCLIFYIAYWVLMNICKKRYSLMILLSMAWYALSVILCIKLGRGSYWYNSSQLLVVGVFWATYEDRIIELLKKKYVIIAPIIWTLFIILTIFRDRIANFINVGHRIELIMIITAVMFVLSVLMVALKVKIGNKVLGILGEMSLEMYLTQGVFTDVLKPILIHIENEFLWCLVVLAGTIIVSYFLHKVTVYALKKYKVFLRKMKI